MKKSTVTTTLLLVLGLCTKAQLGPEVTSWIINTTGETGYNNIPSNIQQVQYSDNNVYISATCIPGYDIGPWPQNPNTPTNQNFVYKITRHPAQNTGTATSVGLGHTGVLTNGVSIYNASDARSYNNEGKWNRNAYYWEGVSFDSCLGHPAPNGEYHHHVSPRCLYEQTDSAQHSPIIGYAFDGFPVYGVYAYTNTDGTGLIKRMKSSYVLSSATTRENGPDVSETYPAGCFMEDYIYTQSAGDLDERNGRFCITPEYPKGTYAYFATIDEQLLPTFPYTLYKTYYGVVQAGNTGANGGHNTISEPVITYTSVNEWEQSKIDVVDIFPNPASSYFTVYVQPGYQNNISGTLYNTIGERIQSQENIQPAVPYSFNLSNFPVGIYFLKLEANGSDDYQIFSMERIVVAR